MTTHPIDCECDTYGCQMRRKGILLSYDASPTRRARRPWREKVNCSENGGLAGEPRSGGTFMPYLDLNGEGRLRKVHTKEGRDRRTEIAQIRDRHRKGPALNRSE